MATAAIIGGAVLAAKSASKGAKAAVRAGELQAQASTEAARISAEQQQRGLREMQRQFNLGREDIAPFRELQLGDLRGLSSTLRQQRRFGTQAKRSLKGLLGFRGAEEQLGLQQALLESPAQQALRERSAKLIDRRASATGGLGGGAVLSELFSQDRALDQARLDQEIARLTGLMGAGAVPLGVDATGLSAQLAQAQGAGTAGILGNIGATQAAGITGAAQAQASGLLGAQQARAQGMQNMIGLGGMALGAYNRPTATTTGFGGAATGAGAGSLNYGMGTTNFSGLAQR